MWQGFLLSVLCILFSVFHHGPAQFPDMELPFDMDQDGPGPMMELDSVNITAILGETATLPCYIKNLGSHHIVSWLDPKFRDLSDNDRITIRELNKYSIDNTYPGEVNLIIQQLQTSDEGSYTCMLQVFPPQTKMVYLTVAVPARIGAHSFNSPMAVKEGTLVDVVCEVTGTPWISVNWYYFNPITNTRELFMRGETLTIPRIQRSQGGTYECETQNQYGDATKELLIDVQYPPNIELITTETELKIGTETSLRCIIDAHPAPQLIWKRGSEDIQSSWKYETDNILPNNATSITGFLGIMDIQPSDAGEYFCVGQNNHGRSVASTSLIVILPTTQKLTTTSEAERLILNTEENVTQGAAKTGASSGADSMLTVSLVLLTVLQSLVCLLRTQT